jgi:NADPH2:quinone reductase
MRAVWYANQGPAREVLEIGDIEAPSAGPGEVRVRIHTSGVNPVDVKRRAGGRGQMEPTVVIPHFDGGGVVEKTGEGVDASRIDERVWVYEAQWRSDFGTAAEYVTVPANRAVPLPPRTSFEDAACLGIPALTAHRCVYGDGPVNGKTVFVTGGAGAVGNYAIQFARLGGARVLSTVSGDDKMALAKQAGAHEVINYREEDVEARVMAVTGGEGVDRIVEVELGDNLSTSLAILKPNGIISAYASEALPDPSIPFYSMLYKNLSLRFELVFLMREKAKQAAVSDISSWLVDGSLHHHLADVYPLKDTAAAHEAVEGGPLGKVLLNLSD